MNEVVHVGPSEPGVEERIAEYNRVLDIEYNSAPALRVIAKLDDGRILWAHPFGLAANEVGLAMANVRTLDGQCFRIPVYNIWLPDTATPPWVAAVVAQPITPLAELLSPADGDSDG